MFPDQFQALSFSEPDDSGTLGFDTQTALTLDLPCPLECMRLRCAFSGPNIYGQNLNICIAIVHDYSSAVRNVYSQALPVPATP